MPDNCQPNRHKYYVLTGLIKFFVLYAIKYVIFTTAYQNRTNSATKNYNMNSVNLKIEATWESQA
jgi:hypothetical protein